ncbi:MAG: aminodeoxychorismate synthase component I [Pseudonocardiaceae bacterium]
MRTLIIDNYDSFTYNLFHYMAEVTGVEPVVLRNDDPGVTVAGLACFDNVIISPGPGRPERSADFGVCAEVIRAGVVPVLGVCLGHQGICHIFGCSIQPAPEPYHGRFSPVLHNQVDILAGLPSPFSAVRYHSLVAEGMSDELEPIGWTPDGILMAVRHRYRPLWGVQFHPESICTEHGHQLLRNFAELTRRWRGVAVSASRPVAVAVSAAGTLVMDTAPVSALRVLHRRLALKVAPEVVFDALYRESDRSFWLDSSQPRLPYGRFSFMGDASGPLSRIVTTDIWAQRVTVGSVTGVELVEGGFFDWVRADLAAHPIDPPDLPFDFALGWVGYLGYELKAECGGDRVHRSDYPDAMMLFADRAIAFDHEERVVYLLALAEGQDDPRARGWLADTATQLQALATHHPDPVPDCESDAEIELGGLSARHDRARYLRLIAECQREITAGESYEVCLTNMLTAHGKLNPVAGYRLLRARNPAPFAAQLRFGTLSVLSCSPERFLHVSRDGMVESRPIKGTRPRSDSPAEDEMFRADLATSMKDHAENLMIVDLVRNDLGTCAEIGSVRADELFEIETYATVHQLVSTIRARLRADRSAVDCVRAAFPGGSMTGAPKIRTMRLIDELEGGPRGVYSGVLGYFSLSGAADFSIVIRTLVIAPDRIEYGVGGAIIALSNADEEFEETAVKATSLLRLLRQDFPERSTPLTPGTQR